MSTFLNKKDYIVSTFESSNRSITMKKFITITYAHTFAMKESIKIENWGYGLKKLYYYIDYTFRARFMDKMVKLYTFNGDCSNIIGIYCLNLFKRNDIQNQDPLYLVFTPNHDESKYQDWCVQPDFENVNQFCMTKQEIMNKYNIKSKDIPVFHGYNWNRICHDEVYNLNWNDVFRKALNKKCGGNTKDILVSAFSANGVSLDTRWMRQQLAKPFAYAFMDAIKKDKKNGNYIIPALYFKQKGYEVAYEVLLEVVYPYNSQTITTFAILVNKHFEFVRLVTVDMAAKNARLVTYLPQNWITEIYEPISDTSTVKSTPKLRATSIISASPETSNSTISSSTVNTPITLNTPNTPITPTFPRKYKMEVGCQLNLINGNVIETIKATKLDVTNILRITQETNQTMNFYPVSQCAPDISLHLLIHKQLHIKSLHEIWTLSTTDEIETINKTIMTINGTVISCSIKSYNIKKTSNGIQKSEIILNNINSNSTKTTTLAN